MARKQWEARVEANPELIRSRDKRKWQIAFRRYLLEKRGSSFYAPYFGLDIENLRKWVELQFPEGLGWSDFGKTWQFDHIIPVACFDFQNDEDLKLCWNFLNIRVVRLGTYKKKGDLFDVLASRNFFSSIFENTQYPICQKFLEKIELLEASRWITTGQLQSFILEKKEFLEDIQSFGVIEFDLLNRGKTPEETKAEVELLKKFGQ